jgi:hypothetical protein
MNTENLIVGINGTALGTAQISNDIDNASREVVNRPATGEEKLIAQKFGANVQKATYASKYLTRPQLFLGTNARELKSETREKWLNGELVLDDAHFYVRKAIAGGASNVINVFTTSMDMEAGITNIDKQKLDDYVNMALSRMELNYDQSTSVTSAKKAEFAPLSASNKDTALMNGELEVIVGTQKIVSVPINQFQEGIENLNCPQNGINFKQPKLIKEKETIQINIVIPQSEAMASNEGGTLYHFIEIVFKGAKTKLRN